MYDDSHILSVFNSMEEDDQYVMTEKQISKINDIRTINGYSALERSSYTLVRNGMSLFCNKSFIIDFSKTEQEYAGYMFSYGLFSYILYSFLINEIEKL